MTAIDKFKELKSKHQGYVFLFRVNDFYVSFMEDAEKVSKVTGVTPTKHNGYYQSAFPYHALDINLTRLVRNGYRVAICDINDLENN